MSHSPSAFDKPDAVVPLTANRFSYFLKRVRNLNYWNVSPKVFRLAGTTDKSAIKDVVEGLIHAHDGLRLTLESDDLHGWRQWIRPPDVDEVYCSRRLSHRRREPLASWVISELQELHSGFSFPGPLFRVVQMTSEVDGVSLLSFVTHHLLADAHTARMITRDFVRRYSELNGESRAQVVPTVSYAQYAAKSVGHWQARACQEESYWTSLPWSDVKPLPIKADLSENIEQFTASRTCSMAISDVAAFLKRARLGRFEFLDFLLAAIACAYGRWTGHQLLCLAMVFQGRQDSACEGNLNGVAGWLSETVPLLLPATGSLLERLTAAHEQRSHAAVRGRSYGVIRHLLPNGKRGPFAAHPEPEVSLNVVLPSLLRLREGSSITEWNHAVSIPAAIGTTQRVFLLSAGFTMTSEELRLSWDFSSKVLDAAEVDCFTRMCLEELAVSINEASRIDTASRAAQ